jgi:hypothetical protein
VIFLLVHFVLALPTAQAEEDTTDTDSQVLLFNVAIPIDVVYSGIRIELQRLGETRAIVLEDKGSMPEDLPYDGVYVGRDVDAFSRYVQVTLIGDELDGTEAILYAGIIPTENRRLNTIAFHIHASTDRVFAYRVAAAHPGTAPQLAKGLPLLAAFGWTALLILYVGVLTLRRREPEPK